MKTNSKKEMYLFVIIIDPTCTYSYMPGATWYTCSDRTNWDMYFGYCYWGGDCILCTKHVVDSGPGSPSDLVLSSWEIAAFTGDGLLRCQGESVSSTFILVE